MTTPPLDLYRDCRDWWIGYYRGPNHHYVCPLPTLVIRWPRKVSGDRPMAGEQS